MKMKRTCALLLALLMCLGLSACGSAKSGDSAMRQESAVSPGYVPAPVEMNAAAPMAMNAAYDMDMAYEEGGFGRTASAKAEGGADSGSETPAEDPEKIIYSGDATVETTEFDKSIAALEAMIEREGGFIQSSSVNGSNYYDSARGYTSRRSASYTLRVPSGKFSDIMSRLSTFGNVPYTYTYTENVTAQYFDTEAHLKAYQTQEARLLEMMEIAESVEDIVTLEDRLTELRYRIESLQSTLKNWDRRVSYSTVYLSLQEVQEYTPEAEVKLSYGQRLWRSFSGGIKGAAAFFSELLVWLVGALPTLVILAAIVLILRPLFKKWSARRKEKKQRRSAPKTEVKTEDALK